MKRNLLLILQPASADDLSANGNLSTDTAVWGTCLIKLPGTGGARFDRF